MLDVVIPAHEKDIETLDLAIDGLKDSVEDIGEVYVISKDKLTDNAKWIPESKFPFSLDDVSKIIGKHWRTCWYYQQLLKLYAQTVEEELSDSILVTDADTIFLNKIKFIDGDVAYYNIGSEHYNPYFEHMSKLVPGLHKQMPTYSGITHHMVFQRDIMDSLFETVEEYHGTEFWKAFLECTNGKFSSIPQNEDHSGPGRASEYEIYFNYSLLGFSDRTKIRKLNSILAYKEYLGESNDSYDIGSRTNDDVHIKIIEDSPKFDSTEDSLSYAINTCRDSGFDSVTFQKHTRVGIEKYKEESLNYIMDEKHVQN